MILRYGIEESEDSGQEWGVLDSQMSPYQQDEPLADVDDESAEDGEEAEADGLHCIQNVAVYIVFSSVDTLQWYIYII